MPDNRKGHVVADTEAHPCQKMGEEVIGAVKECGYNCGLDYESFLLNSSEITKLN